MKVSLAAVRDIVESKALVYPKAYALSRATDKNQANWIFDFRKILLTPEHLSGIVEHMYEKIRDLDGVQIGGMESAAIPLVTALVLRAHVDGKRANGFYIRKSRKKTGRFKILEGHLNDDPIVLVDDLINSARSVTKQLSVLEDLGHRAERILTIVRFRDDVAYKHLYDKGVQLFSLFQLTDFGLSVQSSTEKNPDQHPYKRVWVHVPLCSSPWFVLPRSTPTISNNRIFFGGDDGYFRALDVTTGIEQWSLKTGLGARGKRILSSPIVHDGRVFFGSYDGVVYAVSVETGRPEWTFFESEWVGSSPAVSPTAGFLYIGLEHSAPANQGSIVALDIASGDLQWRYNMPALTHSSPCVIDSHRQVVVGGNEGVVYSFDAHTGTLIWRFETEGGQRYPGIGGFSPGDIKMAPVYDLASDQIAVSSMDGHVYVLDRATGKLKFSAETVGGEGVARIGVFNSPCFTNDHIIFGALDKNVYCVDKWTGDQVWRQETAGRIFAMPVVQDGVLYMGSNDGFVYEIAEKDGTILAQRPFPERVVCPVVFDPESMGRMYVTTNDGRVFACSHTPKQ